jgi:hypothetical protein
VIHHQHRGGDLSGAIAAGFGFALVWACGSLLICFVYFVFMLLWLMCGELPPVLCYITRGILVAVDDLKSLGVKFDD